MADHGMRINRARSELLLFEQIKLKLAYFFSAHLFCRPTEVLGKLIHGKDVPTGVHGE